MIFKVENGLLALDKEEIRKIKEFEKLLSRDKGSDGDADGRKKYRAFKEFFYIYCVADYKFFFRRSGLSEKEIHVLAIKEASLEDNFKVDAEIQAAIDKYKELLEIGMPSVNYTLKLIRGVKMAERVVESIITGIEATFELSQKQLEENKDNPNLLSIIGNNELLIKQVKQLQGMSKDLPSTLSTLNDALSKLLTEEANTKTARGGKQIGNRATPNRN